MWLCMSMLYLLRLRAAVGPLLENAACLGVALGGAVLTKGTGLVFGFPLGLVAIYYLLRLNGWRGMKMLALIGGIILSLNAGHYGRNLWYFHSITGPDALAHNYGGVENESHAAALILSNLIRNIALHCGTLSGDFNRWLTVRICQVHNWMGVAVNDPRLTYAIPFPGVFFDERSEDRAPAPAHMLVAICALLLLPFNWRRIKREATLLVLFVGLAGFVLFCAAFKWQIWHARLHIPVMCLVAPALAAVWAARASIYMVFLGAAATLSVWLLCLWSFSRPLLGPESLLSADRSLSPFREPSVRILQAPTIKLTQLLTEMRPKVLGLDLGEDLPAYLVQRPLRLGLRPAPEFMSWQPVFSPPGHTLPLPDLVVSARFMPRLTHDSLDAAYTEQFSVPPYAVYAREQTKPDPKDSPVIVMGILGELHELGEEGLGTAEIAVERTLRAPSGLTNIWLLTIFPQRWPSNVYPPVYTKGTKGIWFLQPAENGLFSLPDAAHLRPVGELQEILKKLGSQPQKQGS